MYFQALLWRNHIFYIYTNAYPEWFLNQQLNQQLHIFHTAYSTVLITFYIISVMLYCIDGFTVTHSRGDDNTLPQWSNLLETSNLTTLVLAFSKLFLLHTPR